MHCKPRLFRPTCNKENEHLTKTLQPPCDIRAEVCTGVFSVSICTVALDTLTMSVFCVSICNFVLVKQVNCARQRAHTIRESFFSKLLHSYRANFENPKINLGEFSELCPPSFIKILLHNFFIM
jgi:hypothetical protein